MSSLYPFSAVVGQDAVKEALILSAVNQRIGGVLLCGQKGTAKSTIVRALGEVIEKEIVTLPLNTTEDMLTGTIDFETAVLSGEKKLMKGVLSKAHHNILYVDEVNLLPEPLSAIVTETAGIKENRVEREGISYVHDCDFLLIGTMNSEEGGLKPQLLDRFGLYVEVKGEDDIKKRAEIIKRRLAFEADPIAFSQQYELMQQEYQKKIAKACQRVNQVVVEESLLCLACEYAKTAHAQGNRCELILIETAIAVAAWDQRNYVTTEDIKKAAGYVLPHRIRKEDAKEESSKEEQQEEQRQEQRKEDQGTDGSKSEVTKEEGDSNPGTSKERSTEQSQNSKPREDEVVRAEEAYSIISLPVGARERLIHRGSGHRKKTLCAGNKGRYSGFVMAKTKYQTQIALDATLRAAACNQYGRETTECAITIRNSDFRYQKKEAHTGATILFVVDASGSMNAGKRMKEAKEAILSMLLDSYQKRDKVGMIAFRKDNAKVMLPITNSVELAQKVLQELPTGGKTPLAQGLYLAWQQLKARKRKDPMLLPLIILITDGRANVKFEAMDGVEAGKMIAKKIGSDQIPMIVIDTEQGFLTFHLAEQIAAAAGASYYKVGELKSKELCQIVKSYQE